MEVACLVVVAGLPEPVDRVVDQVGEGEREADQRAVPGETRRRTDRGGQRRPMRGVLLGRERLRRLLRASEGE